MAGPTVFCTEKFKSTGFCGSKPKLGVVAGEYVLLYPEIRYEEAVQYILRPHHHSYRAALLHVKFVYGLFTVVIVKLPEPLPCDYVYFDSVIRGSISFPCIQYNPMQI